MHSTTDATAEPSNHPATTSVGQCAASSRRLIPTAADNTTPPPSTTARATTRRHTTTATAQGRAGRPEVDALPPGAGGPVPRETAEADGGETEGQEQGDAGDR